MCAAVPEGYCVAAPAEPKDRRYYLRDDQLEALTSASHSVDLLTERLEELHVRVEQSNTTTNRAFVRNLDMATQQSWTTATPSSPAYWFVPLVLAFEYDVYSDNDPTNEGASPPLVPEVSPVLGACKTGTQPIAATFEEAIRDFKEHAPSCVWPTIELPELRAGNVAHEVMHALGLIHEGSFYGGLMCATVKNYVASGEARSHVLEQQKANLRATGAPNFVPGSGPCPQRSCP
jgi:hypothetical protein